MLDALSTNILLLPSGDTILPANKKRKVDSFLEAQSVPEEPMSSTSCRKNLGERKQPPVRSRGYVFVVRAGGHIDMFAPLYK